MTVIDNTTQAESLGDFSKILGKEDLKYQRRCQKLF